MNPETLKNLATILASIAAVLLGFYGVVTRPMMKLFKSEIGRVEGQLRAEIGQLKAELKAELSSMELRLKTEIHNLETRLNDRIDARLARR